MAGIHLIDTISVNKIVWLRSLPEDELGPSNRMIEELETLQLDDGLAFEAITVSDRQEFLDTLASLARDAARGVKPFLHFDCHGSAADGLLLAPSGEHLSWSDLGEALRAINVETGNNLCCLFAACHALNYAKTLSISHAAPFFILIAPPGEISVGTLEERMPLFYRRLHQTKHVTDCYDEVLRADMTMIHAKGIFAKALAKYIRDYTGKKVADDRRGDLIPRWLEARGITSPTVKDRKMARDALKAALTPSQKTVDHFAGKFLIGREPGVTFEQVVLMAAGGKALQKK